MNNSTKELKTTLLQYKKRRQSDSCVRWDERSDGVVPVHCSQGSQHNDDLNYAPDEVVNSEVAKNAEDVEKKLQMWKNDIRLLLESRQEQDIKMMENNDQMIRILISMFTRQSGGVFDDEVRGGSGSIGRNGGSIARTHDEKCGRTV